MPTYLIYCQTEECDTIELDAEDEEQAWEQAEKECQRRYGFDWRVVDVIEEKE